MSVTDNTQTAPARPRERRHRAERGALWAAAVLTAAALAVDAYVHADLAPGYDAIRASVSQGALFRVEAGAAALAALLVLVARRSRMVWLFAFLVAAGGVGAVLLYRYVDVGGLGPFPDMYEPVWYPEKSLSAVAEAVGAATALLGLSLAWRRRRQ
ncbi:hypothetical protein ABH931_006808 [Streptacidiphilus sp. MAP12-33]|uniref:hypothetical protein n=1 Tax=Streptacidiphilus sp. MAP12-33 TaxID=3156266 RepID=UPI0035135CDE